MKKALFCLLVLFSCHVCAQFYPAEIFYTDGTSRKGLVEPPKVFDKNVKIKNHEFGVAQKIKSSELERIVFEHRGGGPTEIVRILPKIGSKLWADLEISGPMSLYTYVVVQKGRNALGNMSESTVFYGYCKRDTEKRAGCLIPGLGFSKFASNYFSDYPELAEKIRNKEDGYRASDLHMIVREYNQWKMKQ